MVEGEGPGVVTLGAEDRAAAVAAVKAALRVASDDEDGLVAAFAETALGLAERFTGQVGIARGMAVTLDAGGWEAIEVAPVRAIDAVSDAAGAALAAETDVDADGVGWVRAQGRVRVALQAGLADGWDGLPAPLRQGVVMLAAHLFDDRDGDRPVPAAVTALWRPFRVLRLAERRRP